jgi:hypothetical protein
MGKPILLGIVAVALLGPATALPWGWEVEEDAYGSPAVEERAAAPVEAAEPTEAGGAASLEPAQAVETDDLASSDAQWLGSIWSMP